VVRAKVEGIRLGDWREQYVRAARANNVAEMRRMVIELSAYVREHHAPRDSMPTIEAASWQSLCAQAQNEHDAGKLLKLVTEINRLLEEEQDRKRPR